MTTMKYLRNSQEMLLSLFVQAFCLKTPWLMVGMNEFMAEAKNIFPEIFF